MRKKILLTLLISLFTVGLWAADVSVVERFSQINQTSAVASDSWPGDVCNWSTSYTRHQQPNYSDANYSDYITIGTTNMPSSWMSFASSTKQGVFQTTDLEGGIKAVAFRWAQFGKETSNTMKLEVKAGTITDDPNTNTDLTYTGSANRTSGGIAYSKVFECKSNAQLSIKNISTQGGTAACRILIGDITITPYLLYTQKKVVISPSQTGYINNGLIDNTESEGSITYSIHDKDAETQNVAEINPSNGAITPKAIGKAIVTATWTKGASTSYELIVANTITESFTNVVQTGSSGSAGSNWVGDVCSWTTKYARRKNTDLINDNQATWLTLDGSIRGYIKTTNLEGGLLGVSFDYAQFGAEANTVLIWKTSDGTNANYVTRDGDLGKNPSAPDTYSYAFENKQNVQLEILNASIMDDGTQPSSNARLLMSDVTIAPYLLYTTKEAALDTRNGILTYTNNSLVDNTAIEPGTNVVYSISSEEGLAGFNTATGEVTATESTQGNYTITATWGEVSTSYVLAITSRNETSASFNGDAIVNIGLSETVPAKTLTYTDGYDGTTSDITYSSNNTEVATVANDGTVTKAGGVGQAIITAHLAQTANYKAAEASYIIQVTDDGANIQAERFSAVTNGNAATHTDKTWDGDLFDWYTTEYGGVRKNGDKFPSDNTTEHTGIWMGIPEVTSTYATLQSNEAIEGGIKHLSFYWEQWGTESEHILNPVVYIKTGENEPVQKASVEYMPTGSPVAANRMLIGINNIQSNSQLIIRNESHKSDGSRDNGKGRIILDEIHITPYLLYTNKAGELDMRTSATTYKNDDLINNTGTTPTYSISPTGSGASIDNTGLVTAEDGTQGDFTITASWGDVSTSYVLTIISRNETSASYANAKVLLNLGAAVPANTLTITDGYNGTITYNSSNTAVATVASNGTVTLAGGVGQTTITAILPQTDNYKAASASYILQVTDNSANVLVEAFSAVPAGNAATHAGQSWTGDVYGWKVSDCGGVRKNGDKFASDQEREGIWMGTPDDNSNYSSLTVEGGAEGGIKHIWFFCEQPYNMGETGYTLKPVVYLNEATAANKVGEVEIVGTSGAGNIAANRTLFGASNVTKSNSVLIIRNESYQTDGGARPASNRGRILLDEIHITPWLLYTTKEAELDLRNASTYTNADLINNTESGSITYTLEGNDEEATIDAESGEVTGLKAGQVTVKATWSEGAFTTYTLNIIDITETEASYPNAEIHATMGEAIPANALVYTDGYDGEISYASSVPAVADFENGVLTLKAPGQTKITATLPETSNYTAATASYMLTVSYANYESFNPNTTTSTYAKPEENAQGDVCKWYAYIGGVQTPNYFSSNAITTRAQRTNESKQGYVKSEKLSGGISALAFNYSMMFADNNIENWDIRIYVNDRLVGQLTNEEGGDLEGINGRTLNPMRTKVITGIDEPGQFVIRFENHSTVKSNVEYETGNMGRFAIDNVSWENFDGPIVLNESTDNSSVIVANSGATADVEISRSALVKNVWNTLCLPFAISKTTDLDGADVKEMTGVAVVGDVLEIYFSDITDDELTAGKPYLVKPASNKDISKTYANKQISMIASPVQIENVTMQGMFSPLAVTANDYNTLFVGTPDSEGNNLFYPQANGQLRGMRAYFKIGGAALSAPRRARYVINQKDVTTDIEAVMGDGLQVTGTQKILRDGQLFIIRDGKMYNAQGQVIK